MCVGRNSFELICILLLISGYLPSACGKGLFGQGKVSSSESAAAFSPGEGTDNRFYVFDAVSGKSTPITGLMSPPGGHRSLVERARGSSGNSAAGSNMEDRHLDLITQGIKVVGAVAWFFVLRSFALNVLSVGEKLLAGANKGPELPSHVLPFLAPNITLNSYEMEVAQAVSDPSSVNVEMAHIGGLRDVKHALWESTMLVRHDVTVL